jgi:diacylglycerol kinase
MRLPYNCSMQTSATTFLVQLLVSAFLAILFLQSGIDKIVDRQGNEEWLKGHFAKSPLAGMVSLLFGILTIVELAAGVLSGVGFVALLFTHNPTIAFYGAILSAIAILCLFFGQRIAKEYAGAAVLVPYFLLTIVAIYLLGA